MADTDDLEALAARLEDSGDYRILRRVPTVAQYAEPPTGTELRRGLIVDVETTGVDPTCGKVYAAYFPETRQPAPLSRPTACPSTSRTRLPPLVRRANRQNLPAVIAFAATGPCQARRDGAT